MTRGQAALFEADRRRSGRTRRYLDQTVRALRDTGRLEPIDQAMIGLCRRAVDLVDEAFDDADESRFVRARTIAEARACLVQLRDQTRPDVDALSIDDLFAAMGDTVDTVTPE